MPEVSIETLTTNLDVGLGWREGRHQAWTTNYPLYLDTVITNRLRGDVG